MTISSVASPGSDSGSYSGEFPDAQIDEAFTPISAHRSVRINIVFFDVHVDSSSSQKSQHEAHTDERDSNHLTEAGLGSTPHYHQNLLGGPLGHEHRQIPNVFKPSETEAQAESLKRNAGAPPLQSPSSVYPQFDSLENYIFHLSTNTWPAPSTDNIAD